MKKDIWNSVAQYLIKRWVTFAVWLGERIPPPRVFDCFENIWPKKWILLFELRAHSTNISACITVYDCQDYIGILSQMGLKYFLLLLFFPTSFIFLLLIMCSRSSSGGGGGGGSSVTVSFGYFFVMMIIIMLLFLLLLLSPGSAASLLSMFLSTSPSCRIIITQDCRDSPENTPDELVPGGHYHWLSTNTC